jgi:antitoxin component YwqK of YwqJK toxin-antitoxin module
MKKRHFGFLFIALSVFVSCSDNIQKSYWDDGTLKSELRYKDGKLDGECVWYYSNGQKVLQAFYKDDLKEGHALRW